MQILSLKNLTTAQHTVIRVDFSSVLRYIKYAGDINGDGAADIFTDKVVIFGRNFTDNMFVNTTNATIIKGEITANFTATDGILFNGVPNIDPIFATAGSIGSPYPVGDINNDNRTDLGLGYYSLNNNNGVGVVINPETSQLDVSKIMQIKQQSIFTIEGVNIIDTNKKISYREVGYKIDQAGDFDKNGIDDFIIGNYGFEMHIAVVLYGSKTLTASTIYANAIPINVGLVINYHYSFSSIISGVDLNGDGYQEIGIYCISSREALIGQINIFWGGKNKGFIDTYNMNQAQGIILQTPNISSTSTNRIDYYADLVADTNNDKFGELLVGSPAHNNTTGMARLVLGRTNFTDVNLSNDNMPNVVKIYGEQYGDKLGYSVAYVGDLNKDGRGDFAVCAPFAHFGAGACYVLMGRDNWPSEIHLKDLTASDGFKIIGSHNTTKLGDQVVRLGKVNDDDYDDFGILVKDENAIYVIYGGNITNAVNKASVIPNTPTQTLVRPRTLTKTEVTSKTISNTLLNPITLTNQLEADTGTKSASVINSVSTENTASKTIVVTAQLATPVTTDITKELVNTTALESKKVLASNAIPEDVANAITQVNEYGSIARVLALNPASVSQGARIESVKRILSCGNADHENFEFSRAQNPTGVEIDYFGKVKEAVGTFLMNTMILGSSLFVHYTITHLKPKTETHFPSMQIVPYMYFLEPVTKAVAVMMFYGGMAAKAISGIVSIAHLASLFGLSKYVYSNFDAEIKNVETQFKLSSGTSTSEMWVSPDGSKFTKNFGYFFDSYKTSMRFFMPIEVTMNMATGIFSAIDTPGGEGCEGVLYSSTFVYSGYAAIMIVSRPYESMIENAFAITIATAQATPLIIESVQSIWPAAYNITALNQVKDTLPTITEGAIAAKTLYDIANIGKRLLTTNLGVVKENDNTKGSHIVIIVSGSESSSCEGSQEPLLKVVNPLSFSSEHNNHGLSGASSNGADEL